MRQCRRASVRKPGAVASRPGRVGGRRTARIPRGRKREPRWARATSTHPSWVSYGCRETGTPDPAPGRGARSRDAERRAAAPSSRLGTGRCGARPSCPAPTTNLAAANHRPHTRPTVASPVKRRGGHSDQAPAKAAILTTIVADPCSGRIRGRVTGQARSGEEDAPTPSQLTGRPGRDGRRRKRSGLATLSPRRAKHKIRRQLCASAESPLVRASALTLWIRLSTSLA